MNSSQFWKNFMLGEELSISGAYIYNGIRRFHEMQKLEHVDEMFEVFYCLSVGLERLLKIAVVLLEHNEQTDQTALEKSLITHNHLELLNRIKCYTTVNLSNPHQEFLSLLATFYKSHRYERFSLTSIQNIHKERHALCAFFAKHLHLEFEDACSSSGTPNEMQYRKFLRNIVEKIASVLFQIIRTRAQELNLHTYELRHGSKAQTVFQGEADIPSEDILWKELLIFFMNTKATSACLEYLRRIPPLEFDPGCAQEYLDCFRSNDSKAFIKDELDALYETLPSIDERLKLLEPIGEEDVLFDDPCSDEDQIEPKNV